MYSSTVTDLEHSHQLIQITCQKQLVIDLLIVRIRREYAQTSSQRKER